MIYFVTENFLKINTPITKNVDVTDVYPYVKPASDMRLQAILGSYFYNYLLTQYNDEVLTPDEITLVEKIQFVVAWRAAEQAASLAGGQLSANEKAEFTETPETRM